MTATDAASNEHSDLWGICAYFNPLGYERRLANYRLFRSHLSIPLVTVEYGYQGRFDLDDDDDDEDDDDETDPCPGADGPAGRAEPEFCQVYL